MRPTVTVITLGVQDLQKSTAFYKKLGFVPCKGSQEGVTFFQCNGLVIALFARAALAEDAQVPEEGSGFSGITLAHNTRSREEVDAVMKEAEEAGAVITKPAQEVFWGGYNGYFKDPDGHLWEVAHNPFWSMNDAGEVTVDS